MINVPRVKNGTIVETYANTTGMIVLDNVIQKHNTNVEIGVLLTQGYVPAVMSL